MKKTIRVLQGRGSVGSDPSPIPNRTEFNHYRTARSDPGRCTSAPQVRLAGDQNASVGSSRACDARN